ncbi:MAG TPA: T9SS type A sorting domain-containing protein [Saprospiraceae bacterium]|nr:T9SS type A sorting domain-containing protein [Saprospiraceae bacterium]
MNRLYFLFSLLFASILFLGYSDNPPNGYTGAPGDGMCTNCHTPGGHGNLSGNVEIQGLPTSITPGNAYTITVRINNNTTPPTDAERGGFQLVALDQSNNNIGTFSNASSSSTITPSGGRSYWEHNPAKNFSGGNQVCWTVTWTAPTMASGQVVTMYTAAIIANIPNGNSNDLMDLAQATGNMPGPPPLGASITQFKNISCNGFTDGSITVLATNGVPPYSYNWSNGLNTSTVNGLSAGSYSVTVSDNIGASVVLNKTLTQPTPINLSWGGKFNLNCASDADGLINLTVTGGISPYSYNWSNGQKTKNISNLKKGDYTVTVSDNNSCEFIKIFTINAPDALSVQNLFSKHPACPGESSGDVELITKGGTEPYSYTWNTGEKDSRIRNKLPGTYMCTITDKNNCVKVHSLLINVLDTIKPSITKLPSQKLYLNTKGYALIDPGLFKRNVTENCDTGVVITIYKDTFTCKDLTLSEMNISVKDLAGNVTNGFVSIEILDTIRPSILTWKDSISYRCNLLVPRPVATDNCVVTELKQTSGPQPDEIFPVGSSTLNFTAKDQSNNFYNYNYEVQIKNPLSLKIDTLIYDRCTGRDPEMFVQSSHALQDTYRIFVQERLIGIFDTFLIQKIKDLNINDSLLFIEDNYACREQIKFKVDYPDTLIRLLDVKITNPSSCLEADGKILLEFNNGNVQGFWYDESLQNKLPNQNPNQFKVGKYYFIASDKPEGDSMACLFTFGPFELGCNVITKDFSISKINVYPNPSNGRLTIHSEGDELIYIAIQDSRGQIILNKSNIHANIFDLELSDLSSGLYLISIQTREGINRRKWLLSKM